MHESEEKDGKDVCHVVMSRDPLCGHYHDHPNIIAQRRPLQRVYIGVRSSTCVPLPCSNRPKYLVRDPLVGPSATKHRAATTVDTLT